MYYFKKETELLKLCLLRFLKIVPGWLNACLYAFSQPIIGVIGVGLGGKKKKHLI
jgi:hypothetical protein